MKLLSKFKKSARTFLLLSTTGGVLLGIAPAMALYQLLRDDNGLTKKLFDACQDVGADMLLSADKLNTSFGESFQSLLDPDYSEDWLREHKKIYRDNDE